MSESEMNDATASAARALRGAGLAVTMPRLSVLTMLLQADQPLPAVDIQRFLIARGVGSPLSSTYAALKRLIGAGLVVGQEFGGGKAHFCIASKATRHRVQCVETGAEYWLPDTAIQAHIAQFCLSHGFELQDYTLAINVRRVSPGAGSTDGAHARARISDDPSLEHET